MIAARLVGPLLLLAAVSLSVPASLGMAAGETRTARGDAAPSGVSDDEDDDREETGKSEKGKREKSPITVRGCLHGTTLGDVQAEEDVSGLTPSLALRSSREMRRTLKEYDRHQVEITGVLTRARSPLSGRWGGTTVTVGAADPRRSPAQQTQPAVASLEVESVQSLSPSCP